MIVVTGFEAASLAEEVSPVGGKFSHTDTVCLCNVRDDLIHTVVILNRFNKWDLEATVVGDGTFISRMFIRSVYEYVFLYEQKNVMMMFTSVENDRMNKIHEKMGHKYIGEIPGKFGEQDAKLWIATPEILERWKN